ncbi:MAG: hypothetical protein AB7F86_19945 [Bdellovibrionales bacterium]
MIIRALAFWAVTFSFCAWAQSPYYQIVEDGIAKHFKNRDGRVVDFYSLSLLREEPAGGNGSTYEDTYVHSRASIWDDEGEDWFDYLCVSAIRRKSTTLQELWTRCEDEID